MTRYWAVIPAAGIGQRMQADRPKQYLPLAGACVIEHTLQRLLDHPKITGAVVALAEHDSYWPTLSIAQHPDIYTVQGGEERCHSVLNALQFLANGLADEDDWVLVHDAARPCIHAQDLDILIEQLPQHPVGGLLGVPVHDTMKRATVSSDVESTVERQGLWHAYTPQMFRHQTLLMALTQALDNDLLVTDDASAIEQLGLKPHLIEGRRDNIKITRPEDLALATFYLQQQA